MHDVNEDILQKLAPSIVEIISDKEAGSSTLGTGFVITDDGLIVTCRHVVTDAQEKLMKSVRVRFHSDSKTGVKYTARPVREDQDFKDDPSIDIAFLRLDKLPEKGVISVKLDDKVVSLNNFASIGFKKAEEFTRLSAEGKIRIPTQIRISKDVLSPEVIQLYSPDNDIEPGMSGAPILDIERDRVVGIITERYEEQYSPAASNMAFALPVKSMIELYPKLREKNVGLTRLSKFLSEIGEADSSIYDKIEEIYVPPNEYSDIQRALEEHHLVFITGTPEFGKTFTAVKLLYEYFEKGYRPRWIRERKESLGLGRDVNELLNLIQKKEYLNRRDIVYFEDPFGKTKYERSSDLEDYIDQIIENVKNVDDSYVIITSREEVFKEFEQEMLSSIALTEFEKKINLKRASYSLDSRNEILIKWAKSNNCAWLFDSKLREVIVDSLKEGFLPTPMNIKEFTLASKHTIDEDELRRLIERKSANTAERFSREILQMEDEKVLFLCLPYIGQLNLATARETYTELSSKLAKFPASFDEMVNWFKGDKITISQDSLTFSHPSYQEAFRYSVQRRTAVNRKIASILSQALIELAYKKENGYGWAVVEAIVHNFQSLSPDVKNILLKLADENKAVWILSYVLAHNFQYLPQDVRESLLFKLADKDEAADKVIFGMVKNFNSLSPDAKNFFLRLASQEKHVEEVLYSMSGYFEYLPQDVRESLLFKLADKHPVRAMDVIVNNFGKIAPDVREKMLFKFADRDDTAQQVATVITYNFDSIPSDQSEILLSKLADKRPPTFHPWGGTWYVAEAILRNFQSLSPYVQNILFKQIDQGKNLNAIAAALDRNFQYLPQDIRESLLSKLADKTQEGAGFGRAFSFTGFFDGRDYVLQALARNFDDLSPDAQGLLFNIAKSPFEIERFFSGIVPVHVKMSETLKDILERMNKGKNST